jgi:hypothetical protein
VGYRSGLCTTALGRPGQPQAQIRMTWITVPARPVPRQVSVSRTRGEPSPIALVTQVVLPAPSSPVIQPVPKESIEVFLFFSSRLGCLGSLAVSVILTLILLALFHVL